MASAGVGAIAWFTTGSLLAIPIALAAGVLVDVDHVVDIFDSEDQGHKRHMLRLLHAWEYLLVTLVVVLVFSLHPPSSLGVSASYAYKLVNEG